MIIQYEILKLVQFGTDINGHLFLNPFYKCEDTQIKENYKDAADIYKGIFRTFLIYWAGNRENFDKCYFPKSSDGQFPEKYMEAK